MYEFISIKTFLFIFYLPIYTPAPMCSMQIFSDKEINPPLCCTSPCSYLKHSATQGISSGKPSVFPYVSIHLLLCRNTYIYILFFYQLSTLFSISILFFNLLVCHLRHWDFVWPELDLPKQFLPQPQQ